MSDERAWDYCSICGRKIPAGEMCYGVKRNAALLFSGDTICKDCIAPENYEPAPAADVAPVVHGRWVVVEPEYLHCSVCGEAMYTGCNSTKEATVLRGHWKRYCPNCGAPMTDEAVEMVMEKINNMEEMTNEH